MSVGSTVRMAAAKKDMSQTSLAKAWGVTVAAINNKFYRDSWSAADLMKVAEITGSRLAFVFPDGQQLFFSPDEPAEKKAEE